jgi:2-polyprenyl-3-methyl-5-hydroxy-6-metoxy-1,4-benzoquinol methylase
MITGMEGRPELERIRCSLCSRDNHRPLYHVADGIDIVLCNACGLAFMNPRYTNEYLKEVYQDFEVPWVQRWKDSGKGGDFITTYRKMLGQAARYEDLKLNFLSARCPEKSACDVGFGAGVFLVRAAEMGWKGLGVEIKKSSCDFLSENFNISTIAGEFPQIDFGDRKFGCVTMFALLEHVTDPRGYVEKAREVLLPGGVLLVEVPNLRAIDARFKGARAKSFRPEHHHLTFFTRRTLGRFLSESGFEAIEVISPMQFKPMHPVKRFFEALSFAMQGESTLRMSARKPV